MENMYRPAEDRLCNLSDVTAQGDDKIIKMSNSDPTLATKAQLQ